jgi:hypothetical protein
VRACASGLLACAALVTGCGGGGKDSPSPAQRAKIQVVLTVRAFQDATLNRDPAGYCHALTSRARADAIGGLYAPGGGIHCKRAVRQAFELAGAGALAKVREARRGLRPRDVRLRGSHATVRLPGGGTMELVKVGRLWLIDKPAPLN